MQCMCDCMYAIYVCTFIFNVCIYIYMYVCRYVWVCNVYMYVCVYVCNAFKCKYVCVYKCMYVYICV